MPYLFPSATSAHQKRSATPGGCARSRPSTRSSPRPSWCHCCASGIDLSASQVHRLVSGTPGTPVVAVHGQRSVTSSPAHWLTWWPPTAENACVRMTATGDLPALPTDVAKLWPRAACLLPDA